MNRIQAAQLLGIQQNASNQQIKDAYKKGAKQYHPDRPGGSKEQFQNLQKAYDEMMKPQVSNPFNGIFKHAFVFQHVTQTYTIRSIVKGEATFNGIRIPHWVRHGDTIRINESIRLQIQIQWPTGVKPKSGKRNDIILQKTVGLQSALLGHAFRIMHPEGIPLFVKPRSIVFNHGKQFIIRGQGLKDRSGMRGDLYVEFSIRLPDSIDMRVKEKLETIIGTGDPLRKLHNDIEVECVEI